MSDFKKNIRILRYPALVWYLLSVLFATFASGVSYVAMSWWVLEVDNSVSATALLMFCFWVPVIVLGAFLGAVTDRYSRKWMMVIGNGMRGLVLLLFVVLYSHSLSVGALYVLMLILGIAFSAYLPATMTLVRELVLAEDLLYANSLIDIACEVGNVMGMGSAGFLVAWLSQRNTLLMVAVMFFVSVLLLIKIRVKESYHPVLNSASYMKILMQDLVLGMEYLRTRVHLIIIYSVQLCILVAFMTAPILLAPFAKNVLHATVSQFGGIDAAISVGIILGNMVMSYLSKKMPFIAITKWLCTLMAILFVLFGLNRDMTMAVILNFFIGFGLSVWPLIVTRAQQLTEFSFQARMQSLFQSFSGVIILAIYLLLSMGEMIPIMYFYILEAAVVSCAVYLLWRYRHIFLSTVVEAKRERVGEETSELS